MVTYMAPVGFSGFDSVHYRLKTKEKGDSVDASVYIVVVEQADNYEFCEGETVSIGVKPKVDTKLSITYEWYSSLYGESAIASGAVMNNVLIGKNEITFYVHAIIDGNDVVSPRIPILVKAKRIALFIFFITDTTLVTSSH